MDDLTEIPEFTKLPVDVVERIVEQVTIARHAGMVMSLEDLLEAYQFDYAIGKEWTPQDFVDYIQKSVTNMKSVFETTADKKE